MDNNSAIIEYKKQIQEQKLIDLLKTINDLYNGIKEVGEDLNVVDKQELFLHKIKQYKLIASINNKEPIVTDENKLSDKITIKDLIIKEINYLEQIQNMLQENDSQISNDVLKNILLDQQIYMFKLMYYDGNKKI